MSFAGFSCASDLIGLFLRIRTCFKYHTTSISSGKSPLFIDIVRALNLQYFMKEKRVSTEVQEQEYRSIVRNVRMIPPSWTKEKGQRKYHEVVSFTCFYLYFCTSSSLFIKILQLSSLYKTVEERTKVITY